MRVVVLCSLVAGVLGQQLSEPKNIVEIGAYGQPRFRATELPDLTAYGPLSTLARHNGGEYTFGAYMENDAYVRFYLSLKGIPFGTPWFGIGFGESMLGADFIVAHLYNTSTVEVHEHVPRNQYAPPFASFNPTPWVMEPLNGGYVDGNFFVEVRKPLVPEPRPYDHETLVSGKNGESQRMIWAYNPASVRNHWTGFFAYHGENPGSQTGLPSEPDQTHGAMSVNFEQKTIQFIPVSQRIRRVAHASGMFVAWLVLFPAGAFWSRYMRFLPRWIWVHVGMQVLGVFLLIASVATIVATLGRVRFHAHSILGLIMISLLVLQLLMGLTNRTLLRTDLPATNRRRFVRLFHRINGYILLLASIAQVALGLRILYPIEEPRGDAFWIMYFLIVGFWVVLFGLTEAFRRLFFVIKTHRAGDMVEDGVAKYQLTGKPAGIEELAKRQDARHYPELKSYNWKTLDEAVSNGKLLVVADGRYVYDVSKWIFSHPGGQLILLAVAGTDVTSDYFNEAGYDAAEFTPPPLFPQQNTRRQTVSQFHEKLSEPIPSSQISVVSESFINTASLVLTQTDWYRISRARRTHVHTKLAIMRLSHLLVGEIISSPEKSSSDADTLVQMGRGFDRFEYRRYALTQKELLTDASQGSSNPIWRLRFCLLYPYETRDGQPEEFQPGECVEVQVRVDGVPAARYYSPVSGNITAFDLCVKQYPSHGVSACLCRERPGETQFKIRGPFGQSLVPPVLSSISSSVSVTSHPVPKGSILFVAGGTGITPFLQLLQHIFLPTGIPLKAASGYEPTMPDELAIAKGDNLVVRHHYMDGWAMGCNTKTGQEGVFPLPKTFPRYGPYVKLVLLNCVLTPGDMVGSELIDAVLLAYPQQFEVHHVIKAGVEDGRGQFSGFGYEGEISEPILKEAVSGAVPPSRPAETEDNAEHAVHDGLLRVAFVCGPPDFNTYVRGELENKFEYKPSDITVLSSLAPNRVEHGKINAKLSNC
ncbi:hypothetical protein PhCBS80983_g01149 [Powellomyces hirtus]|uniref:Cytochrome b5 heme-binding domain-containing protein n=1 Tax=Powellomyces hirtus TaxID=109895 RepID=A0A507EC67_9FUNG|nr:hypothetical protein PhCBS80983_g01149 [Powellomyces hirtus]